MNRLNEEIKKKEYTMKIVKELTGEEKKHWEDMWLLNKIRVSIRKGR